jgi:hypothetical protein
MDGLLLELLLDDLGYPRGLKKIKASDWPMMSGERNSQLLDNGTAKFNQKPPVTTPLIFFGFAVESDL